MLYSRNEEYRTNLVNRFPYHIEISQGFYLSFTPTRTNQSTFVFDSHCGINTGRHEPNLYSLIMQLNTVACVADYMVSCYSIKNGVQFEV